MSALRYLSGALGAERAHLLVPENRIARSSLHEYHWHAQDADAAFLLTRTSALFAGWYMVEIELEGDFPPSYGRLFFDTGNGFEDAPVNVVLSPARLAKRLVKLTHKCHRIRFEPRAPSSHFNVRHLRFVPVSKGFAIGRMLKRISNQRAHLRSVRGQDLSRLAVANDVERTLREIAAKRQQPYQQLLVSLYQDTFCKPRTTADYSRGYDHWIADYEQPRYGDPSQLRERMASFTHTPTLSIVMPVHPGNAVYLREAIASVVEQVYTHWELRLLVSAACTDAVRETLSDYAEDDARIVVVDCDVEVIDARSLNLAVDSAKGAHVSWMCQCDTLAPHALFAIAKVLNKHSRANIVYSDHDEIDAAGKRVHPHFKPDWNRDLFYSRDYIQHLTAIERSLISDVGGFRSDIAGGREYDLLLRVLAHCRFSNIHHVPAILYHARQGEREVTHSAEDATQSGIQALQDHLAVQGMPESVVEQGYTHETYRIRYPIAEEAPQVSLLVPTRDNIKFLEPCVSSILRETRYEHYEVIVVNNQSSDPETLAYLQSINAHPKVRVLAYDDAFNYSAINNFAARHARGDMIGLINNDTKVIDGDWLREMVSHAQRPDVGCVGAKLLYRDRTVQHAGVVLGLGGVAGHGLTGIGEHDPGYHGRAMLVQNYSAVTAACLLLRKSLFEEVGGLDEKFFRVAFNDVDLCLKVREAGYRNLWTPYATLFHYESKSRGHEDTPENLARFHSEVAAMKLRWNQCLFPDPAYNLNLALDSAFRIQG